MRLLLDAGANATRAELIGPLDADERPVAELLVAAGFDVDETERWGPLLARVCRPDVARNSVHRARVLLAFGADPNRLGQTGLARCTTRCGAATPTWRASCSSTAPIRSAGIARGARPRHT